MDTTFLNQLTKEEINKGLRVYTVRCLWDWILLAFVFLCVCLYHFSFFYVFHFNIILSIWGAMIITLLLTGWYFCLLRRQFSPTKTATYQLNPDKLEVTNSNGSIYNYPYDKIRVIDAGNIGVLCYPKRGFSVIAWRHLSPEQKAFLLGEQHTRL